MAADSNDASQSAAGDVGVVRDVTDAEVAFFVENGWVLLRGLVAPEVCEAMLRVGKSQLSGMLAGGSTRASEAALDAEAVPQALATGAITNIPWWVEWRGPVRASNDPVFSQVTLSSTMGRNAQRMLQRDRRMRIFHDMFLCKLPDGTSTATDWHQDAPSWPFERNGLTAWIALDEITPEQGPVQFYSGSHRVGLLGDVQLGEPHIVDEYPELARFPVSPAHHLQPGDCTVHHSLVVHGAGANLTTKPRWSYLASYFPADARYTGAPNHDADGYGLEKGKPFDHPSFALVRE